MDRQFLEFWGNYLLMAAKGQQQLEDAAKWMHQGFKGFDDLTDMFGKFYGLDPRANDPPKKPDGWNQATADFEKSLADWMRLMGWVPASEQRTLHQKVAALEEKVQAQERTIRYLRNLLDKEGSPHAEAVLGFAELVQKQTREFQDLVKGMTAAIDSDQTHVDNTTKEDKHA